MITTIVTFIIVLSLLVFVHELGHFVTAKKIGAKVEEFGFGFPPKIWGFKRGETTYSINWIPIGGFVKIKGESGEGKDDTDSFASKAAWKKFIVLAAGVFMNFVLAAVLLGIGFGFGLPHVIDGQLPDYTKVRDEKIQVLSVLPDSPAYQSGFVMGDAVNTIDGQEFESVSAIQEYIGSHEGQAIEVGLVRGNENVSYSVTPEFLEEAGDVGLGVALAETGIVSYPWYISIWKGIESTFVMTIMIVIALYEILKNLIITQQVGLEISGPVGIAVMTGQMAKMGFAYLIQFTAVLSINLAIINFLPFPALDGGRILFLLIEKIRRKDINEKLQAIIHNTGFIFLIILLLLITFRDIGKFSDQIVGTLRSLVGL